MLVTSKNIVWLSQGLFVERQRQVNMSSVSKVTVGDMPATVAACFTVKTPTVASFSVHDPSITSSAEDEGAVEGIEDERKLLLPSTAQAEYGARSPATSAAVGRVRERLWPTVVSALIASISALLFGYTYGFPSTALLDLTGDVRDLPENYQFTTLLSDVFAAIGFVGAMFGGPIAGSIADHWGRKTSLVLCGVPYFIGYLMLSYAHYLPTAVSFKCLILIGRFITGLGMGWTYSICPVYIAEISTAKLRGLFGTFVPIFLAAGILINFSIGSIPGFPYYYNSLVAAGITAVFEVLMVWLKETPRWLVLKGHSQEAYHALIWLRGRSGNIEEEIQSIESSRSTESVWEGWKEFSKRSVAVPVVIVLVLMFLQEAGGISPLSSYAASVFRESGVANPRDTAAYAVGGVELLTVFLSIFIIDLIGRKILLIISGIGMTVGTAMLGVHFYITRPSLCASGANSTLTELAEMLQDSTTDATCNTQYGPLAIVSIVLYIVAFSIGWAPVPVVLLAELIPLRVRGLASGIATFVSLGTGAVFVFLYMEYAEAVQLWFVWWTFTAINAVGVLFVIIFLRETRGKTLEEIEKYYEGHRF